MAGPGAVLPPTRHMPVPFSSAPTTLRTSGIQRAPSPASTGALTSASVSVTISTLAISASASMSSSWWRQPTSRLRASSSTFTPHFLLLPMPGARGSPLFPLISSFALIPMSPGLAPCPSPRLVSRRPASSVASSSPILVISIQVCLPAVTSAWRLSSP